jgi:hypothetical protein
MIAVLAKHQELVMDVGWKPLPPPASVSQKVIQIPLQLRVVMPRAREVVRNPWKPLKESKRLDF